MKRLRDPRYGMMVSDGTGTWMLITRRDPMLMAYNDGLVWWAIDLGATPDHIHSSYRLYQLLLDPDQFGEVEA